MNTLMSRSSGNTAQWLVVGLGLAIAWVGFNVWLPEPAAAFRASSVNRVAIHAVILAGLWLGLARTDLSSRERIALWLAIAVPFTLWLGVVWDLALNDFFRSVPGVRQLPPRLPVAILLPLVIGLPLLMVRAQRVAALLDAMPPAWLIALQVYRIFGGIFLVGWIQGDLPGAFAVPAGIGDMTVGVLALPVAIMVASGTPLGRTAGIAWNLLGIADLTLAVTTGALTSPGPLHVLALDHPNLTTGIYPNVMVPAFAVPSSIILHVLSIWQLRRAGRRVAGDEAALAAA